MPTRQVYGKRSARSAHQVASCFGTDSPEKRPSAPTHSRAANKSVRRPLESIDFNARLQSLTLEPPENDQTKSKLVRPVPSSPTSEQSLYIVRNTQPIHTSPSSSITSDNSDQSAPSRSTNTSEAIQILHNLQSRSDTSKPLESFAEWGAEMEEHFAIDKIAEATYGEVYRLRLKQAHPTLSANDESVLKVIALQSPTAHTKKKIMSSIDSVISEVQLLQRMATVPGFVNFREISIVQGRPCKSLVSAWKVWNKERPKAERSQFPDPSRKASYSDQQLWAIVEMQDAGTDLERTTLPTIFHVWDVFWAVALSLAKAEQECKFEHRDLHLGNICVRDRGSINRSGQNAGPVVKPGLGRRLGYSNLETTIIDYTLSRTDLANVSVASGEEGEEVAFFDLAKDLDIFCGNADDDYQYEIYRMMRSIMLSGDPTHHLVRSQDGPDEPTKAASFSWRSYKPQNNLIWLHFVLETLLSGLNSPSHSDTIKYGSSEKTEEFPKDMKQTAVKLEKRLRAVQKTLDVQKMQAMAQAGLASAGDLIWLSLEEGWLKKADVVGVNTH